MCRSGTPISIKKKFSLNNSIIILHNRDERINKKAGNVAFRTFGFLFFFFVNRRMLNIFVLPCPRSQKKNSLFDRYFCLWRETFKNGRSKSFLIGREIEATERYFLFYTLMTLFPGKLIPTCLTFRGHFPTRQM